MVIEKAVNTFINKRLQAKLRQTTLQYKKNDLIKKYEPFNWIADAAKRASQIQFATHTVKGIHPDAKGTNFNAHLKALPEGIVGTASLKHRYFDIVGNAAALDVYKFLNITIDNNTTLLDLIIREDERVLPVLSPNRLEAKEYLAAFKQIIFCSINNIKADERIKQILWPTHRQAHKKDSYFNVIPLYPTMLVHKVYQSINAIRLSEQYRLAKEARRNKVGHPSGYKILTDLACIKLGGSKPQNISQLNSERGGCHFLLPSLPPQFLCRDIFPPIENESIFKSDFPAFINSYYPNFLGKIVNNSKKRRDLRYYVIPMVNALIAYGLQIRGLEGGWSLKANHLSQAEAFWLDPNRAKIDTSWAELRQKSDWKTILTNDFVRWFSDYFNVLYKNKIENMENSEKQKTWEQCVFDIVSPIIRRGWGVFE